MEKLISKERWNRNVSSRRVDDVQFSDIFKKYMKDMKIKSCLEIGSLPGRFLTYLSNFFNCPAEGVDYIPGSKKITEETLKKSGVDNFKIYEEDFFTWNPRKKYDLVSSFGFVEHFEGRTNDDVIQKHINLLNKEGYLVLEVPNLRGIRYIKNLLFDRKILKKHNLKIMKLSYFRKISKDYGLKIIYLNYHGGGFFGMVRRFFEKVILRKKIDSIQLQKDLEEKLNDPFFSSSIIFIAKKE